MRNMTVAAARAACLGRGRTRGVILPFAFRPCTLKPASTRATALGHFARPVATKRRYSGVRLTISNNWCCRPPRSGKAIACRASQYSDSPIHSATPPLLRLRTGPTERTKCLEGSASGHGGEVRRPVGSETKCRKSASGICTVTNIANKPRHLTDLRRGSPLTSNGELAARPDHLPARPLDPPGLLPGRPRFSPVGDPLSVPATWPTPTDFRWLINLP
jgi:hypothetical protein